MIHLCTYKIASVCVIEKVPYKFLGKINLFAQNISNANCLNRVQMVSNTLSKVSYMKNKL